MVESRSEAFHGGSQLGSFHSSQQGSGGPFRPDSVLVQNQSLPSGMGMGSGDRARLTAGGGMLPTVNGSSEKTYAAKQWLAPTASRQFG